jgi:hypothetical protein
VQAAGAADAKLCVNICLNILYYIIIYVTHALFLRKHDIFSFKYVSKTKYDISVTVLAHVGHDKLGI